MPRAASSSSPKPKSGIHLPGLLSRGKTFVIAFLALGAVAILVQVGFDWREVPAMLERVNRPLALAAMALLPIVGFPISAVYLAAGALFGPWVGGAVVLGITVVHVGATHLLAQTAFRRLIERWHERWSDRVPEVPEKESATLVAMLVIVPGLPYIARNWLLVFSRVPLRYLVVVAVPLYVARSYVTIFLGDLTGDPSRSALMILAAVFAVKLAIGALLFVRLKRRVKMPRRSKHA